MQEKEIKLLFDAGALSKCIITRCENGEKDGFIALFVKTGKKIPEITLDTRPRKSGDTVKKRVFSSIDTACILIQRKLGFQEFLITKIN